MLLLISLDIYPPFTPMNCKFFFVEGDPGSPSAFRFMMERRDCGDDAGNDIKKKNHNSRSLKQRENAMIKQYADDTVLSVATWLWGFLW